MKLATIVKMSQQKLARVIHNKYSHKGVVHSKGDYLLVPGDTPVMLVAHMDTVHMNPVKKIVESCNGNKISSPQGIGGDDRCGVYGIMKVYAQSKRKPWLLFTHDEEIGAIGADKFVADYLNDKLVRYDKGLQSLKFIIELDRKGRNDAVFYGCDNEDFEKYITGFGFKTEHGSFSDISYVAPALEVAAVNLSCGYYNPHTKDEYILISDLEEVIDKVGKILEDVTDDSPQYEYIEREYEILNCKRYSASYLKDFTSSYQGFETEEFSSRNYLTASSRSIYDLLANLFEEEDLDSFVWDYGEEGMDELFDYMVQSGMICADCDWPDPYSLWEGKESQQREEEDSKIVQLMQYM